VVCVLYCVFISFFSPLSPPFCMYDHVHSSLFLNKVHITFYVTLFYDRNYSTRLLFLDDTLLSLCSLFPSQAASYVVLFHTKKRSSSHTRSPAFPFWLSGSALFLPPLLRYPSPRSPSWTQSASSLNFLKSASINSFIYTVQSLSIIIIICSKMFLIFICCIN
jgi:hypothetical protein